MNTTDIDPANKLTHRALLNSGMLVLLYILLIILLPANTVAMRIYHLNLLEYRAVLLAVSLPSLAVWLAAFIGYATLRQYATTLHRTPEGIHFQRLALGCAWLAWGLPLSAITALFLNAIGNQWPGAY